MEKNFNIIVGITGTTQREWEDKLNEVEHLGIKEVSLFLVNYDKEQRQKIYWALSHSHIQSIPLVHLREDMEKSELELLEKKYKTKYFTCHESDFVNHNIEHWKGLYKDLYLEMNTDGRVAKEVNVAEIGGFCIDTGHFKVGLERTSSDFAYVDQKKEMLKYFACNHISGWVPRTNKHIHRITSLQDFDYLKLLPRFVFSNVLALEVTNSIKAQLTFKEYIAALLEEKFK
ncbi:hypothetical protein KW786_03755 [Candidatus Parcubacteria bacterium]|nr:hypothetical protein [Candidatus Parcubacteria bacterium]